MKRYSEGVEMSGHDSSENKVLFEITERHLNTGLRGFPVGTVRTSRVDPQQGVSYVGYPVGDLANLDPEAVVYLLYNKTLPTPDQLDGFKADLARRAHVDSNVIAQLKSLPKEGHPMEWLITGIMCLGMTGRTGDYREDGLNLIARSPELIANIFRLRSGWVNRFRVDQSWVWSRTLFK